MVNIPAPGWFAEPDDGSLTKDLGGGDRVTVVTVPGDFYQVPGNICHWRTNPFGAEPDREPGSRFADTMDEFFAHLAEQTYDTPEGPRTRDLSTPVDITIGGQPGYSATGAVPGIDPSGCDEQRLCSVLDRYGDGCRLPHLEANAQVTIWLSAPPDRHWWIVAATHWPTTSPELLAEMDAIVDSMTKIDEAP
jgi:hypothetical protein